MDIEPWRVYKSIRGLHILAWSGGRGLSRNLNSIPLHHLTKIFVSLAFDITSAISPNYNIVSSPIFAKTVNSEGVSHILFQRLNILWELKMLGILMHLKYAISTKLREGGRGKFYFPQNLWYFNVVHSREPA
jgi:hypothetical protein